MASKPPAAHEQETIGGRLKRLRLERGLSQRELASPGVSYAYISRIEAGTRQPSVKALRRLAGRLGVSADYLETGAELPPAEGRELRLANLELAIRLGEGGDVDEALETLLADALAAGDAATATRARVALAQAASARGDLGRMMRHLEASLEGRPFDPLRRPETYAGLGEAYIASGRPQLAVALYERCLAVVRELGGAAVLETRYATLLANAVTEAGDSARAADLVEGTLRRVEDGGLLGQVRLHRSLGRLAEAEGRPDVALDEARRALALLDAEDESLAFARAHVLAASLLIARQDADGAAAHLDAAERLLVSARSADVALVSVRRAQVAGLRGDGAEAVRLARAALAGPGDELPELRGSALYALGDGLALEGERDAADAAYSEAVGLLEDRRQWREATHAARAWARMLRDAGREQAALDVLDRAAALGLNAVPGDAPTP
ncbi:MAG: helix-turn-helix domain-containing protein [Actinobacteria bacterium]|nr:helix-turn-helix domain-containing protein [Actinomycetota bacterium]